MPIPSVSKISHFAQFATSSRLLSCLVTEGLLSAYILPMPSHSVDQLKALCVIIYDHVSFFRSSDIHSVIPLKEIPVLETSVSSNSLYKVKLLDPMDMLPAIYTLTSRMSSEVRKWNDWHDRVDRLFSILNPLEYLMARTWASQVEAIDIWLFADETSRVVKLSAQWLHRWSKTVVFVCQENRCTWTIDGTDSYGDK
jgi:hypothetical protein